MVFLELVKDVVRVNMKHQYLLLKLFLISCQSLLGQIQFEETRQPTRQGWNIEISAGLDFISNLLINPAVGAGESRLGFGALLDLNSTFNQGNFTWTNNLSLDYGIQKIGSGTLPNIPDKKVPFQKTIDNIWLNSKAAQRTSYFSKLYYAADVFFSSQLTKTYEDNFLTDVAGTGHPVSKFLSPALFQFSLGMDYKSDDHWSVFLSPASFKTIIVADDKIADDFATDESGDFLDTIHGNPFEMNEEGEIRYENYDHQFGAALRVVYDNQITNTLAIRTNLMLFSNYLRKPQNIDVNLRNQIDLTIVKGLKLSLLSWLTYDHDILVQVTDNSKPKGVSGFGRRVSYTQQLLLKYSFIIDQRSPQ